MLLSISIPIVDKSPDASIPYFIKELDIQSINSSTICIVQFIVPISIILNISNISLFPL